MEEQLEEISGGAAVVLQAFVLFFIGPFFLFMIYLVLRVNFGLATVSVTLVVIVLFATLLKLALSSADLYFSRDIIVVKKIFGTKRIPVINYKTINEAFMPNKYYVEFNDGSKVYFTLKTNDLFKRITTEGNMSPILIKRFDEKKSAVAGNNSLIQ